MIDHTLHSVSNYAKSKQFYTTVLRTLGYELVADEPEHKRVGFDSQDSDGYRIFWIVEDLEETHGSKYCLAFKAQNKESVENFHQSAIIKGGAGNGAPGYRKEYGKGYYAAYILDPDNYNIEAVFDDM